LIRQKILDSAVDEVSEALFVHVALPAHPQYKNINHSLYSPYIQDILLVHEKRDLYASETYHSTSIGDYQQCIVHLVDKDKYIYNKGNIRMGTTM
jgi:hypothetical protein